MGERKSSLEKNRLFSWSHIITYFEEKTGVHRITTEQDRDNREKEKVQREVGKICGARKSQKQTIMKTRGSSMKLEKLSELSLFVKSSGKLHSH